MRLPGPPPRFEMLPDPRSEPGEALSRNESVGMDKPVDREDAGDPEAGDRQAVDVVRVDHVGGKLPEKRLHPAPPRADRVEEKEPGIPREPVDVVAPQPDLLVGFRPRNDGDDVDLQVFEFGKGPAEVDADGFDPARGRFRVRRETCRDGDLQAASPFRISTDDAGTGRPTTR